MKKEKNINKMNITFERYAGELFLQREKDYERYCGSTNHSTFLLRLLQLMQDHRSVVNVKKKYLWYKKALDDTKSEYMKMKENIDNAKKNLEGMA